MAASKSRRLSINRCSFAIEYWSFRGYAGSLLIKKEKIRKKDKNSLIQIGNTIWK